MIEINFDNYEMIKSFFERLHENESLFADLSKSIKEDYQPEQFIHAKEFTRKLLTEASLLELDLFVPIFSEYYNVFNAFAEKDVSEIINDELLRVKFVSLIESLNQKLHSLYESILNTIITKKFEDDEEKLTIDLPLEKEELNIILQDIKDLLNKVKDSSYFSLKETSISFDKEALKSFLDELNILMNDFNVTANVYITSPNRDSFYEYMQVFDQIKGNVDLMLASLDDMPEDNHPLMVFYNLCELFEGYNKKIYKLKDVFTPEYIPLTEVFSIINHLISELEAKKNMSSLTSDLTDLRTLIQNLLNDASAPIENVPETENQENVTPKEEINTSDDEIKEILPEIEKKEIIEKQIVREEIAKPEKLTLKNIPETPHQEESFMKIRQDYLENLTNMVGELIVAKSTLAHIKTKIQLNDNKLSILQAIENSEKMFERIIGDIDNTVLTVRLQKVKDVFSRFPRLVRDIAKNSGKKIDLEIIGQDLELDNIILKQIGDPLMHIIRNSCDHGIESPEQRLKQGKSETGKIILKAEISNQKMYITIKDDGNGLDPDVLKAKAIEKGLLTDLDAEKMTANQAYQLIFMPGFSTAKQVTEISGRGVGMDVVMQNIQKVKGEVLIDSVKGRYTQITMLLPLTISLSKGLLIGIADETYIIPIDYIVSIEHIEQSEVHSFQEGFFINFKDLMLGFRHLAQILYDDRSFIREQKVIVVILDVKGEYKALAIDKIYGIQDLSIKNLPDSVKDIKYYNGCSIMSDGRAVIVLNILKLFDI